MPERQHLTLSKRIIDRLAVDDKDSVFWDRELPGFGVRVYPSGAKVYVVQTRAFGRSKRVTVGRHGTLTADEARKEAARIITRIKAGESPVPERARCRADGERLGGTLRLPCARIGEDLGCQDRGEHCCRYGSIMTVIGRVESRSSAPSFRGEAPSETEIRGLNPQREKRIVEATGWQRLVPVSLDLRVDVETVDQIGRSRR